MAHSPPWVEGFISKFRFREWLNACWTMDPNPRIKEKVAQILHHSSLDPRIRFPAKPDHLGGSSLYVHYNPFLENRNMIRPVECLRQGLLRTRVCQFSETIDNQVVYVENPHPQNLIFNLTNTRCHYEVVHQFDRFVNYHDNQIWPHQYYFYLKYRHLNTERNVKDQVWKEVAAFRSLRHPNIAEFHDCFSYRHGALENDRMICFIIGYGNAGPLRSELRRNGGRLDEQLSRRYFLQLLDCAHEHDRCR